VPLQELEREICSSDGLNMQGIFTFPSVIRYAFWAI
jgi:hypothetical protein